MTTGDTTVQRAAGAAVWRGADQRARDWIIALDAEDRAELVQLAERLARKPLDEIGPVDFPLVRLKPKLERVKAALHEGTGFVMLRGLPADSLPRELLQTIYWGLGQHLGIGVSQSTAGDRLGEVYDRGTQEKERYYTRGGPLEFHMDPADVVGLLCLRTALSGGASRIVSAGEVHNIIYAERPDLLPILYRGFYNSRRGHGQTTSSARVPVFAHGSQGLECYYLPATIRQATEEGHALSEAEEEALALLDAVANRPGVFLDMDFRPGDIQFLNNRTILHARTDYVDHPQPELKRYLLRLWLMMPNWAPRHAAMNFHDRVDQAGGGVRPQKVS